MAATVAGARQYGNYMDLAEVKEWLRFPNPTVSSAANDKNLQRTIDMACVAIQRNINRPVGAQEFWERHDGWSGEYIMLKETPFLELLSCSEWQSSGGSITLGESTPENPIDGIQIDYSTGRIMRTFAGYSWPRPFFPGSRNIEVTYLAGFNPVPPDLWMATVELVAHWWRNTQQRSSASPSVSVGAGYDPPLSSGSDDGGLWPAMPYRIENLIAPYRKVGVA